SVQSALPPDRAVSRLHGFLRNLDDRGQLDRSQKVRGEGRRRGFQETSHRTRPVQVRRPYARRRADHGGLRGLLAEDAVREAAGFQERPRGNHPGRHAEAGRNRHRLLLDAPQALELKRDPTLRLAFSGGIGIFYLDFFDQWDPKSPWHDRRVRLAATSAI